MKVTKLPPVHAANLVANSGNTAYGADLIVMSLQGRKQTKWGTMLMCEDRLFDCHLWTHHVM